MYVHGDPDPRTVCGGLDVQTEVQRVSASIDVGVHESAIGENHFLHLAKVGLTEWILPASISLPQAGHLGPQVVFIGTF